MDVIKLPVIVDKLSTLKDGSVKITLETRELPPKEMTMLFSMRNAEIWSLFARNNVLTNDIPDEKPDPELTNKTPGQRLRNVLYIMWTQKGKPNNFEEYYKYKMESIIETIKEKLDEG